MQVKTVPVTRTRATRCAKPRTITIQAPHREIIDEDEDDDDDDDDDFTFVFATRRYEWLSFIVMQLYKRGGANGRKQIESLRRTQNGMIADTPIWIS